MSDTAVTDAVNQDDFFTPPRVPGTLPDLPGEVNLLPIELLVRPLRVEFDEWGLAPNQPGRPASTVSLLWDDRMVDQKVMQYPSYTAADLFLTVPADQLSQAGTHTLRYRISNIFDDSTSRVGTVLIDWRPPSFNQTPRSVILPAEVIRNGLTREYLDANNHELLMQIPPYAETRQGDQIEIFWQGSPSVPGDDVPLWSHVVTAQEALAAANDPTAVIDVKLPEADILSRAEGSKTINYFLKDRAGNTSALSLTASLIVTLAPAPALLKPQVPAAADGLITRFDAAQGVEVWVPAYAYDAIDTLAINWGGQYLVAQPIGSAPVFPLRRSVPWDVLAVGDHAEVRHDVAVTYSVVRGVARWTSPMESVAVDFSVAGPANPSIDPINPRLPAVTVKGVGGDDVIGGADAGQPVRVELTLYDNPEAGQRLDLFWGRRDQPVADYTVQPGDGAGQGIVFQVPWAGVVAGGGGEVPVRYTTFNGINGQQSPDTTCRVSLDDELPGGGRPLKEGAFTRTNANNALNYANTRGGAPYRILLDYANAAVGDELEVFVQGYGPDGVQPLPGTGHSDRHPVEKADLVAGYFEFTVPERLFTRTLYPGPRNLVNVYYQVTNLAGQGVSALSRTLIDMRGDS